MARADELVCSRNLHFFRPSQPMFRSCSFNCFAGSDLNVAAQGRCFQLGLASEKHGEWRCEPVVNIADLTFVWSSFCICILIICSLATEREKKSVFRVQLLPILLVWKPDSKVVRNGVSMTLAGDVSCMAVFSVTVCQAGMGTLLWFGGTFGNSSFHQGLQLSGR